MKTTKRIASQADATGEQQLAGFIKKFDSKNAALIRSVRKVLRKRLPTANELVYDYYNFFVIGYCSTERPSDCISPVRGNVGLLSTAVVPISSNAVLDSFRVADDSLRIRRIVSPRMLDVCSSKFPTTNRSRPQRT
jgi:hypothetical protein